MNSEETASQSCYPVSLSSVFLDLYRLYSVIYILWSCYVPVLYLQSPHHHLSTFYFKSSNFCRLFSGFKVLKAFSLSYTHPDYYCCFLTWNQRNSLYTTFPFCPGTGLCPKSVLLFVLIPFLQNPHNKFYSVKNSSVTCYFKLITNTWFYLLNTNELKKSVCWEELMLKMILSVSAAS